MSQQSSPSPSPQMSRRGSLVVSDDEEEKQVENSRNVSRNVDYIDPELLNLLAMPASVPPPLERPRPRPRRRSLIPVLVDRYGYILTNANDDRDVIHSPISSPERVQFPERSPLRRIAWINPSEIEQAGLTTRDVKLYYPATDTRGSRPTDYDTISRYPLIKVDEDYIKELIDLDDLDTLKKLIITHPTLVRTGKTFNYAFRQGRLRIMVWLLANHIRIDNPLDYFIEAMYMGHLHIVEFFLKEKHIPNREELNIGPDDFSTPQREDDLIEALANSTPELYKLLLIYGFRVDNKELLEACELLHNTSMVEWLKANTPV